MVVVAGVVATHSPALIMDYKGYRDMARIVATVGPRGLEELKKEVDSGVHRVELEECGRMFAKFRQKLDETQPEVLLVAANDQFVNFFLNLIPQFCIYIGEKQEAFIGNPPRPGGKVYKFASNPGLARYILEQSVENGIDLAFSEKLYLQHTQTVNLYYLNPDRKYSVIQLYVNCGVPPTPTPARCYEFGRILNKILSKRSERVAILGTGGLSHYSAGGYVKGLEEKVHAVDEDGDRDILRHIEEGTTEELAKHPFEFYQKSGNVEMLNWLVVLGALEGHKGESEYFVRSMGLGGAFIEGD
jgi:aromatic ring-opening dioxygenase catalytic subunit (LigB family)